MSQKNIYKPRYKIAYQAKSKVWTYKNSRLRGFFSIRGRRFVRRGLYMRYFMAMNSMKWVIARRAIRPYMRRTRAVKRRFRDAFYTKQQLRHFYGKIKEGALRNFFKNHLRATTVRNNFFFAALERRLDMVVFRMRLLPTVFAAHQLIHHQGVLVNGKPVESPNAIVKVGDIVGVNRQQWQSLYWDLYYRIYWRRWGLHVFRRRQYSLLKKKLLWVRRMRFFLRKNLRLKQHLFKTQVLLNRVGVLLQFLQKRVSANKGVPVKLQNQLNSLMYQYRNLLVSERRLSVAFRGENFATKYDNYFVNLLAIFAENRALSKAIMFLMLRIKLVELSLYLYNIETLTDLSAKEHLMRLYHERRNDLLEQFRLWVSQFDHLYRNILRLRLRRLFYAGNVEGKNVEVRSLLYFLARRRSKEERRRRIPRLKAVHWYIPQYMLFDFRTLRAVIVEGPKQEQIFYAFRCSLTKVHSFYRSMGL